MRRRQPILAAAVAAAIFVGAPAAADATTYTGTLYCADRGVYIPLPDVRVELRTPHLDTLTGGEGVWDSLASSGVTDASGHFSLHGTEDTNFVRFILSNDKVHLHTFGDDHDWSADAPVRSSGDYGGLALTTDAGSPDCAAFRAGEVAWDHFVTDVGRPPPRNFLPIFLGTEGDGQYALIGDHPVIDYDAGSPIYWPIGYAPGPNPGQYNDMERELAWLVYENAANPYAGYTETWANPCTRLDGPTAALGLGFASYWANDYAPAPNCTGVDSTDYSAGGNIAAKLANLDANCKGVSRKTFVDILQNNQIDSFGPYGQRTFLSHVTCKPLPPVVPEPPLHRSSQPLSGSDADARRRDFVAFFSEQAQVEQGQLQQANHLAAHPPKCKTSPCENALTALIAPGWLRAEIAYNKAVHRKLSFLVNKKERKKLGYPNGTKYKKRLRQALRDLRKLAGQAGVAMLGGALKDGKPVFKKDHGADLKGLKHDWKSLLGPLKKAAKGKGPVPAGFVLPFPRFDKVVHAPAGDLRRPSNLSVTCPDSATANQSFDVTGTLTPALPDTRIRLTYSQVGKQPVMHTVVTDGHGNYADSFVTDLISTVTVNASFAGDPERKASSTGCSVSVKGA